MTRTERITFWTLAFIVLLMAAAQTEQHKQIQQLKQPVILLKDDAPNSDTMNYEVTEEIDSMVSVKG